MIRTVLLLALVNAGCQHPATTPFAQPQEEREEATASALTRSEHARIIAPLIDPAKLDTLKGDRAANSRLRKLCYWLESARQNGSKPAEEVEEAQRAVGYAGTARATADKASILRNLVILERLGCLDEDGMARLRVGRAPLVTRGPYAGDIAEVDHILPRAIAPELDEKLFNLEFMPARMNRKKGAGIGQRQVDLAERWAQQGLFSQAGLEAIRADFGDAPAKTSRLLPIDNLSEFLDRVWRSPPMRHRMAV